MTITKRTKNGIKQEKKYLIVLVLKILETNTDATHPITQKEIAEQIAGVYPCDRKTVGRNIRFLRDVGYPVRKTPKGFYMAKKTFSLSEIDFIKNAVLQSADPTDFEKQATIEKLESVLRKNYCR